MLLISERIFAMLLFLYPRSFRAAYGQQMRLTFRDACRAAHRRNGASGLRALWLSSLWDLLTSALAERARQGEFTMSKSRSIALAGPVTMGVGALWVAAGLGDLAFQTGLVHDEAFVGVGVLPFILSFPLLLLAQAGIRLRFDPSAGRLGRIGLIISQVGCAGAIAAILLSLGPGGETPWLGRAAVACVLAIRVGYLLFGVDAVRLRLLPRWNLVPLLLGASVVLSLPFDWFGVPALLPVSGVTPFMHFAVSGACWVLLGVALIQTRPDPRSAPAV